jgi:hypothetical protein
MLTGRALPRHRLRNIGRENDADAPELRRLPVRSSLQYLRMRSGGFQPPETLEIRSQSVNR